MSEALPTTWYEANQRYLARAIAQVRVGIERFVRGAGETSPTDAIEESSESMPAPPALETLCSAFELSGFERKILLMCAGAEMDSRFAELYASSLQGSQALQPTFSLALAAFGDAHWSALSPGRPLRYWHLVDMRPGDALTTSPLRIDERVLHYLVGVQALDERLLGSIRPVPSAENVTPSHLLIAERIAGLWSHVKSGARLPIIELCGEEPAAKRMIAATASAMIGLRLHVLPAWKVTHGTGAELDTILRLWEREAVLGSSALLLECDDADNSDTPANAIAHLTEFIRQPASRLHSKPAPKRRTPGGSLRCGQALRERAGRTLAQRPSAIPAEPERTGGRVGFAIQSGFRADPLGRPAGGRNGRT